MKRILATLVGLARLPALMLAGPASSAEPEEQWRGYWVDAFYVGVYTPDQVTDLVADALDMRANALVVQIARRFDCFCNDALFPRTDAYIDPAPYDPLGEVIRQAHAAGIQVHAWVNATTMWNSATAPRSADHVYYAHGFDASGANRWLNQRYDGVEKVGDNTYVDPANPDAVNYIVDAISSIATSYDVDGINLDFIRYPDYNAGEFQNDWGYSQTSLARFAAETGRVDRPMPADAQFSGWRRDQVSALVRKIYVRLYSVDPTDRLSVNGTTYAYGPVSYGGWEKARPYTNVLQDWKGWLGEGTVDTVTAMNYKRTDHAGGTPREYRLDGPTWTAGSRGVGTSADLAFLVQGTGLAAGLLDEVTLAHSTTTCQAITAGGITVGADCLGFAIGPVARQSGLGDADQPEGPGVGHRHP